MPIIAKENQDTKITARWAVNVTDWQPTEEQYTHALNSIQTEERERILRRRLKQDQKLSLSGRLLLRWLFHSVYQVDWEVTRFGRSKNERPILISPEVSKIDFNISHHGDWAVLASIGNFEDRRQNLNVIGVDVMKIETPDEPISQYLRIFREQFSEYEWCTINSPNISEQEKLQRFYRYWCLKESYIKAIGSIKTKTQLYVINEPCPEWKFEESYLDRNHCVAIAYYKNKGDDDANVKHTIVDDLDRTLPFKILDVNHILQYAKEIKG
ncbi:11129_t:CDS:2 [Ambispora leptoticha]|uniref:holo-[acyl-carrier-protein] synthase n=1 Tax=Ambispora leptoticha TaxID=144679 RepID=A0A9N8VEW9_9GLOM|nr:11129_t:CDS:2 [Ambispora leptoticha]